LTEPVTKVFPHAHLTTVSSLYFGCMPSLIFFTPFKYGQTFLTIQFYHQGFK
jgi:hypothetical protein